MKRSSGCESTSHGIPAYPYHYIRSKRSKTSSTPSSSKFRTTNIDHLPDDVLAEILCRLPTNKFVFQSKCVCKRWFALISDPCVIGRFLHLQSDKQTPIIRTLITRDGKELLRRMPSSSSSVLTPMLKKLQSYYSTKEEPVVVATYNDLVLLSKSRHCQHVYYLRNLYTTEWVALPPAPTTQSQCNTIVRAGLICDTPCYNHKDDDQKGHAAQLNVKYGCKVVRLLPPNSLKRFSDNFNVEIFCFETGKWKELVVSFPTSICYRDLDRICLACNGRLYWTVTDDEGTLVVLGFDPFKDYNITLSSFILFDEIENDYCTAECRGVYRGPLIMCCSLDLFNKTLLVWELKERDQDLTMVDGGKGKWCLSERMVYCLDPKMYRNNANGFTRMLGFDPNNKDVLCVGVGGDVFIYNIRTGNWLKREGKLTMEGYYLYPYVLPWWPTPVPRLPQHAQDQVAHGGGEGATSN